MHACVQKIQASCKICHNATNRSKVVHQIDYFGRSAFCEFHSACSSYLREKLFTGYIPVIIENVIKNDELSTNLDLLEEKIVELKPENICCVISVTSCFAPRAIDK
jgi:hypothetical protein